tara:strand:+ start:88 stop:237 length:150 start_codon:yes stop_codon:yes gene_type:complete
VERGLYIKVGQECEGECGSDEWEIKTEDGRRPTYAESFGGRGRPETEDE